MLIYCQSIVVAAGHVVVNLWGNLKDDVSMSSRHVRHVTTQSAHVSISQFVHSLLHKSKATSSEVVSISLFSQMHGDGSHAFDSSSVCLCHSHITIRSMHLSVCVARSGTRLRLCQDSGIPPSTPVNLHSSSGSSNNSRRKRGCCTYVRESERELALIYDMMQRKKQDVFGGSLRHR